MIIIRSSKNSSEVTLICLEATLTTRCGVYAISSNEPIIDSRPSFGGALFGAISWPRSCFRLADGPLLEQQMFLPQDGSVFAFSWALRGNAVAVAQLTVRPFFSGCGPRSYRHVGFRFESEENGGRLTWLPHVLGPKVIADTNGRYHDEPARSFDCFCEQARASTSTEDLITPGGFEFELNNRPSVLIFSMGGAAGAQRNQHVGAFLAGLMEQGSAPRAGSPVDGNFGVRTQQCAAA